MIIDSMTIMNIIIIIPRKEYTNKYYKHDKSLEVVFSTKCNSQCLVYTNDIIQIIFIYILLLLFIIYE